MTQTFAQQIVFRCVLPSDLVEPCVIIINLALVLVLCIKLPSRKIHVPPNRHRAKAWQPHKNEDVHPFFAMICCALGSCEEAAAVVWLESLVSLSFGKTNDRDDRMEHCWLCQCSFPEDRPTTLGPNDRVIMYHTPCTNYVARIKTCNWVLRSFWFWTKNEPHKYGFFQSGVFNREWILGRLF